MMAADLPRGAVIRYPYLWRWQSEGGETEGRKERPVCLAISGPFRGGTALVLLPISGIPPISGQTCLEIPQLERRRAGLDENRPAWITVSEFNFDMAENSFYLDPAARPIGQLSEAFLKQVYRLLRVRLSDPKARIDRTRTD